MKMKDRFFIYIRSLSLLILLFSAINANAQRVEIFNKVASFRAIEGTDGVNGGENWDKLTDGNLNTKWCVFYEFPKTSGTVNSNYIENTDPNKKFWFATDYIPNERTVVKVTYMNYSTSLGDWRCLVSGRNAYTDGMSFYINPNTSAPQYGYFFGGSVNGNVGSADVGKKHTAVISYESLVIDGVTVASTGRRIGDGKFAPTTNPLSIFGDPRSGKSFFGRIYEVKIYEKGNDNKLTVVRDYLPIVYNATSLFFGSNINNVWKTASLKGDPSGAAPNDLSVTFEASAPVSLFSYTLTTGNDTSGSNRNPKAWVLYGSNDKSTWTAIDTQTNAGMPNANYRSKTFNVPEANRNAEYKYFKIKFTATESNITQLSEIGFNNAGYNYNDKENIWKSVDDGTYMEAGSPTWTVMPEWSPVATTAPVYNSNDKSWTIKVPDNGATTQQWQAQFSINTTLPAISTPTYDFRLLIQASNTIPGATIKLQDKDNGSSYLFDGRHDLEGGVTYIYYIDNAKFNADVSKMNLVFDFGGAPAGTTIKVSKIYLRGPMQYTDFAHYSGDVYGDSMGEIPDDLAFGANSKSGYATEWKTNADDPRIKAGVSLQRTHEYERDVYAFPGKTVQLLPFSDYKIVGNYLDKYNRWYDYTTDRKSDRLSFTNQTVFTLDKGVFGGEVLTPARFNGSFAYYTAPANYTDPDGVMDVIAIDVSMSFNNDNVTVNNDGISRTINEPTLQFRNKFVIKDAKKRADEMTASIAANNAYVANHKQTLMCPANVPFQYPLPHYERWDFPNKYPTDFWYQYKNAGKIDYKPVYHYLIQTFKWDENVKDYVKLGETINTKDEIKPGNEHLARTYKTASLSYIHEENYLHHELYIPQPEVGKYKIVFVAIENLLMSQEDALASSGPEGTTTPKYTAINVIGTATPLKLAEYELTVLPPSEGNMIVESELFSNDAYKHQRPEVMKQLYGEPTAEVNFDDVDPTQVVFNGNGDGYYKWPWKWEDCSYAFGYDKRYDFNMYSVVNSALITGYSAASSKPGGQPYDRLYYDTKGAKKGFMYFVNAAGDPGRMAQLNIGRNFCTGTRVYVSAWVMESSADVETANVVFSFRGVKKDGSETILNSFATGYVTGGGNTATGYFDGGPNPDYRGKWMHVYYNFYPEVNDAGEFDHYIIVLENNATNSAGADYAVDDIRAYVCKPTVYARQEKPVCNGDNYTPLTFSANYDQMLQAFEINEPASPAQDTEHSFYYVFVDKRTFYDILNEKAAAAGYTDLDLWKKNDMPAFRQAYGIAYDAALVKNTYGNNTQYPNYGKIHFHSCFEQNDSTLSVNGIRYMYFKTTANDTKMRVGKTYIVSMLNSVSHANPKPEDFDLTGKCSATSEFTVVFSGEVKIDGVLDSEMDGATICSNQRPVITIDMNGITEGGEQYKTKDAYFDWFLGTVSDYSNYKDPVTHADLYESMEAFRYNYPSAEDLAGVVAVPDSKMPFTADMLNVISSMVEQNKLELYKNHNSVSTMDQFNEIMGENESRTFYVTAIPINPDPTSETKYCLGPIQVSIRLSTRTPRLKNGDDHGIITYPAAMRDVPLRIGLRQLKEISIDNLADNTAPATLYVPLRDVSPITAGVTSLIKKADDDFVYLAASNDPAVADNTSGAVDIANSDLKCIGKLMYINAKRNQQGNICHLAFLKDFKFREGYWYTLKFNFIEEYPEGVSGTDVCPGNVICTIKVVPEYQMWTGEHSRNWNDDRNWRRVTRAELNNPTLANVPADFVTDGGVNDNTASFVPADFTKVIIPSSTPYVPYMYDMRKAENLVEVSFTGADSPCNWIISADAADDIKEKIGLASEDINYEMESEKTLSSNYACRTWYDHTCDEIHFLSGSELMDQRYLHYNKAWCDIEIVPGLWQTIASPLVKVVAGDMYLPTDGARQTTPLFENINYDTALNDRFSPAVYQRSWNEGTANVYTIDNSVNNAAVQLNWSRVYNDVNVNYGAGIGFSVKTDVSMLPAAQQPAKVLFRLPKNDTQYTYYNPGNADGDKRTEAVNAAALVGGQRVGRLADFNETVAEELGGSSTSGTKYFLVGNPMMCYLDMKKFFEANTDLAPKYWTVTADGQRAAVMDETTGGFVGTITDATAVAPAQSFFVELASGVQTHFTPVFTADMMSYRQGETALQDPDLSGGAKPMFFAETRAAGGEDDIPMIRISAVSDNGRISEALLTDGNRTQHVDVEMLLDSNLADDNFVYAVKKGLAMSIAQINAGDTIPIAVTGKTECRTIKISGAQNFDNDIFLIDAARGTTEKINGDMELEVSDNGVRYYLVAAGEEKISSEQSMPRIVTHERTVTVYAPDGGNTVSLIIYTADGKTEARADNIADSRSFTLTPGVHMLDITAPNCRKTMKIILR